jgi:hypothetical protein
MLDDARNTAADTNNARNTTFILPLTQRALHHPRNHGLRLKNWCDLYQSAIQGSKNESTPVYSRFQTPVVCIFPRRRGQVIAHVRLSGFESGLGIPNSRFAPPHQRLLRAGRSSERVQPSFGQVFRTSQF